MCSFLLTTLVLQLSQFLKANFYAQKRGPDATTWVRVGVGHGVGRGQHGLRSTSSSPSSSSSSSTSSSSSSSISALPDLSFAHNLLHMTGDRVLQPFVELGIPSSSSGSSSGKSSGSSSADTVIRSRYSSLARLRGSVLSKKDKTNTKASTKDVSTENLQITETSSETEDYNSDGEDSLFDPMLRTAAMFNGEIYNWKELGNELRESVSVSDNSSGSSSQETIPLASDGDILLPLYRKHGENFPRLLDGEFALAVVDYEKKIALLATDAFGTKPLWYSTCRGFHAATYASSLTNILPDECKENLTMMPPNAVFVFELEVGKGVVQGGREKSGGESLSGDSLSNLSITGAHLKRQYNLIEFDLRQFKNSTADWEAAFENAVQKRIRYTLPDKGVVLGLSSGYDSGFVHLNLMRLREKVLSGEISGVGEGGGKPVPLRTYTVSAKENFANVLSRLKYARAAAATAPPMGAGDRVSSNGTSTVTTGGGSSLTSSSSSSKELSSSPSPPDKSLSSSHMEENFVVFLRHDKLSQEKNDLYQNMEPFAYTRGHPGSHFLIHEDVASWGHSWVFRDARRNGYLINLSGTGGDEIYGGDYGKFGRDKSNKFVDSLSTVVRKMFSGEGKREELELLERVGKVASSKSVSTTPGGGNVKRVSGSSSVPARAALASSLGVGADGKNLDEDGEDLPLYVARGVVRNMTQKLFLDEEFVSGDGAKNRWGELMRDLKDAVNPSGDRLGIISESQSTSTLSSSKPGEKKKTNRKEDNQHNVDNPADISQNDSRFHLLEFFSSISEGQFSKFTKLHGVPFPTHTTSESTTDSDSDSTTDSDSTIIDKKKTSIFPPHLFPWPNFFTGTMRDFLMKEELVAGRHGVESRYPFLDTQVVQEYLWLKGDVKNEE